LRVARTRRATISIALLARICNSMAPTLKPCCGNARRTREVADGRRHEARSKGLADTGDALSTASAAMESKGGQGGDYDKPDIGVGSAVKPARVPLGLTGFMMEKTLADAKGNDGAAGVGRSAECEPGRDHVAAFFETMRT